LEQHLEADEVEGIVSYSLLISDQILISKYPEALQASINIAKIGAFK